MEPVRSRSHETYLEGADTVKTPKNGSQEQGVREPEAKPFLKRFRAGADKIDLKNRHREPMKKSTSSQTYIKFLLLKVIFGTK